jgi:hypothetical protein
MANKYKSLFGDFRFPGQQNNSANNKWYGKQLAHIKCHRIFEIHLWLFYKLHKKSEPENRNQEKSKEESWPWFPVLLKVVPEQEKENAQVTKTLINLGWVSWQGFAGTFKNKAPGELCKVAVNFAVEQVPCSDKKTGKGYNNYNPVNNPEKWLPRFPGKKQ